MSTDTNKLLITGASSDIAADLIRALMKRDAQPRVLAHFHRSSERIAALQTEYGPSVIPIQADLSVPSDVNRMIEQVRSKFTVPNKIVHLAAVKLRLERFPQADVSSFQSDLAVQLGSIARILQEFLPAMAQSNSRTKVVFVLSSVTVGVPPKFMSAYTVTKYAQLGLMRALASEYAGTSVNINAASPSMVETRFLSNIPAKAIEIAASQNPRGRNAVPREVTALIEFLLSSGSDYLSGVNIPVAGGTVF